MKGLNAAVGKVRAFNRFYTRRIGLLDRSYLESPYSLTEVRVLYEIGLAGRRTAREIRGALGIDAGYLSRMLVSFSKAGLLRMAPSMEDGRVRLLELTREGEETTRWLDARSQESVRESLVRLGAAERDELVRCMERIRDLLGGQE